MSHNFNTSDPRIQKVMDELGYDKPEEITNSDYDKLEDNFISAATDVIVDDETLTQLQEAGFGELATKLAALDDACDKYDWARENL